MKRLMLAFALATLPVVASTQAPGTTVYNLHGHPQLATYTGPSQYISPDHQCHWNQVQTTGLLGHIHIALTGPIYAEISGPLTVAFTIKMFQWDGVFDAIAGRHTRNVVFDGPASYTNFNVATKTMTTISTLPGTGTSTPPYVNGGPNVGDLITEAGHLTIDPALDLGWGPWSLHGWNETAVDFYAITADGTRIDDEANDAYYSIVDPTQPEAPPSGEVGIGVGTLCNQNPSVGGQLGGLVSAYQSYIPVLPISAPWPVSFSTYNYGPQFGPELPVGFTEVSLDANIHMGIQGTQILTNIGTGVGFIPPYPLYTFDPNMIGLGNHTLLARWEQPTGTGCFVATDGTGEQCPGPGTADYPGNEQGWALVQIPISVSSLPVPPQPSPCVTAPLTLTQVIFPALGAILSPTGWQYLANFALAYVQATPTTLVATDTRGCTATATSGGS